MERKVVLAVSLMMLLSLSLTLIPHVSSQPENIKVVDYSWYIDSLGYFVVVGEVQNTGSSTVDSVGISGTVFAIDGTPQSESYTQAYVKYLVPQQKAPFYMEFLPTNDMGENWIYLGVDHVEFTIPLANVTNNYQYPDLVVKTSSRTIDNGVYWVNGVIQNTGNQTAKNIRVIGTFYNETGTMVAIGYSDILTPTSLSPSGTVTFKLGAFDLNQTEVPSNLKISSYSLLIQAQEPILSGTPPPPSNTNQTSPTDNTPPDTSDTPPNDSGNSTPWSTYAIIAIVFVFAVIGSISLFRYRKSKAEKKLRIQPQKKPRTRKKKR